MADEQIRIDVTARDDASGTLEDVADEAERLERLTPELEVDADTSRAERGLEDVADAARELERQSPELEVTADTSRAQTDIDRIGEDVEALSRKDTEILLRAKIDDARGKLKTLRDDLETTGDRARDTAQDLDKLGGDGGLRTRGNAIADLTGPLGDASGAASDFAGVFDGLGDIAEDVAGKVGLNAAAMSTAIGGIGIAVAAAAALWTVFTQRQQRAAERQRELVDGQRRINEAIAEGDRVAAASELTTLYKDAFDAAREAGIATDDLTRFITGQTESLTGLEDAQRRWQDTQNAGFGQQEVALGYLEDLIGKMSGARDQYQDANGSLAEQDQRLQDVAAALAGVSDETATATTRQERLTRQADRTRDAFDRMRGALSMESAFLRFAEQMNAAMTNAQSDAGVTAEEILDIKQSILDVAEYAKLTPVEVRSLLEKVDNGDLAGVKADVEAYYNRNPPSVDTLLVQPFNRDQWKRDLQNWANRNPVVQPVRLGAATASGMLYDGPR